MPISDESLKRVMSVRVRTLRKRCGLSQDGLAKAIGVDRATINRIERGLRVPEAAVLYAIADELGVTADDLRQISQESEKVLSEA